MRSEPGLEPIGSPSQPHALALKPQGCLLDLALGLPAFNEVSLFSLLGLKETLSDIILR